MPLTKKIQKEDIIRCALSILLKENFDSLNARRLAKELSCSVQPIFYNFANMDDLKSVLFERIYNLYQMYMNEGSKEANSYKGMGMAYIKFAKDYPNFFRILFMGHTKCSPKSFIMNDSKGNDIIQKGMELTGFSFEEQKDFHVKVWIFTHGLATLVAMGTIQICEEEIEQLLQETVREMIVGRKSVIYGKCN